MWRLFYPLRYFSLINKEKWWIDVVPTTILAVCLSGFFIVFPDAKYFESGGFIDKILPLTAALTAFYVAALVAVATFSHPDLDKVITIGSIFEVVKDEQGNRSTQPLTRREFACTIFGYLAFSCLIISVAGAVAIPVREAHLTSYSLFPWFRWLISHPQRQWLERVVVFAFSWAIAHLMVVTCLGLYYLMDRIHRREPRIITKAE